MNEESWREEFPSSPSNNYFCQPDKISQTRKSTQKGTNPCFILSAVRFGWHFKPVPWVQWELPGVLSPGNYFSCTALLTQDKQLNKDSSALQKAQFSAMTALRSLQTPCPVQNNLKLNKIQQNKQKFLTQQFNFYNQLQFSPLSLTEKDLQPSL